MAFVVAIREPDTMARLERLADRFAGGSKADLIDLASQSRERSETRTGSLFGAHPGSITVREGVDLTVPVLDDV